MTDQAVQIPTRATDTDKLYEILQQHAAAGTLNGSGWLSHSAILERCRQRYGHGMTVHSRASTLRKRGYNVENRTEHKNGRVISYYRLVP